MIKKEMFIAMLKNPEIHTQQSFKEQWEGLSIKFKEDIINKYRKGHFTTISAILISSKKMVENHLIMDFLLMNGFNFNKKDNLRLKSKEWLKFEEYIFYKPLPPILNIFTGFRGSKSIIKTVDLLNKDMVRVLCNHFDKIPLELKQRVVKECDSSELLKIYEFDI